LTDSNRGSRALAVRCAQLLDEKKLEDIAIFDVRRSIQITDYFVIASGLTSRHIQSVSNHLAKELRESGYSRTGLEGYHDGKWILLDYLDVVVHLFLVENRGHYDLELLWGDCPRVAFAPGRAQRAAGGAGATAREGSAS